MVGERMKKYIFLLLTAIMLFQPVVFANTTSIGEDGGYNLELLKEDFENHESYSENWNCNTVLKEIKNVAEISQAASLTMKKEKAAYIFNDEELKFLNRIMIEADIFLNEDSVASVGFVIGDEVFTEVLSFGREDVSSLPDNEWYKLSMFVSFDKQNIKAYIDNQLIKSVNFDSSIFLTNKPRISFRSPQGSGFYLDNISLKAPVYDFRKLEYRKRIFGPDFDNGKVYSSMFDQKGLNVILPASAQYDTRKNVAVVTNKDIDGNFTDSIFRGKFSYANPNYFKEALSGEAFENAASVVLDIDLYLESLTDLSIHFVGQAADLSTKVVPLVVFKENGLIYFNDNSSVNYEEKSWYSFRFFINLANRKYSAVLNGKLLGHDFPISIDKDMYVLSCGVQLLNKTTQCSVEIDKLNYYQVSFEDSRRFVILKTGENELCVAHAESEEHLALIGVVYEKGKSALKQFDICEKDKDSFLAVDLKYDKEDGVFYTLWSGMKDMVPKENFHMIIK